MNKENYKQSLLLSYQRHRRWRDRSGHGPSIFFRNRYIFGNFNASSKHFRTFAVGKGKGFEFYRKIFELSPPNLQMPRRSCVLEGVHTRSEIAKRSEQIPEKQYVRSSLLLL